MPVRSDRSPSVSMRSPRVDSAADELRAAIAAAGGAIPFSEFQRIALYGSAGFYTRAGGGRAGRREGAFLTSPEVGPLFGAVLARYLDAQWNDLGRPAQFTVVDAGAGPGTLARSIIAARPACAAAMGTSPSSCRSVSGRGTPPMSSPARTFRTVRSTASSSPTNCSTTCRSGCACSTGRGGRRSSSLTRTARSARCCRHRSIRNPPCCRHLRRTAPGRRCTTRAVAWLADARARLGRRPIDGHRLRRDRRPPRWCERPWREWLRTYRDHGRGNHYLADPGGQDITVEIALDQLPQPFAVSSQVEFLRRWGIDDLVAEGQRVWAANAAAPDVQGDGHAQPPGRGRRAARSRRLGWVQRHRMVIAALIRLRHLRLRSSAMISKGGGDDGCRRDHRRRGVANASSPIGRRRRCHHHGGTDDDRCGAHHDGRRGVHHGCCRAVAVAAATGGRSERSGGPCWCRASSPSRSSWTPSPNGNRSWPRRSPRPPTVLPSCLPCARCAPSFR